MSGDDPVTSVLHGEKGVDDLFAKTDKKKEKEQVDYGDL